MSSSNSYIQYLAIFLLLAVCSIEQVSSARCYSCDSDKNSNCIYNPTQFGVTCVPYARNMNSSMHSAANTEDAIGTRAIPYDCATAVGISTRDGHFRVVRGCAIRPVTCDTYKTIYAVNYDFQVDKCLRCSYDFCNVATY